MPKCSDCYSKQVAKPGDVCLECRSMNLQSQLDNRSTEQKRQEFMTPSGHTLPGVTIPMMHGQMTAPQPPQQISAFQPEPSRPVQSDKLAELQAKIDALKKSLGA